MRFKKKKKKKKMLNGVTDYNLNIFLTFSRLNSVLNSQLKLNKELYVYIGYLYIIMLICILLT
jgi:hypothetical protein